MLSKRPLKLEKKSALSNSTSEVTLFEVQFHIKISFWYSSRSYHIEQFERQASFNIKLYEQLTGFFNFQDVNFLISCSKSFFPIQIFDTNAFHLENIRFEILT